jgi:hypothetical protein
LALPLMSCFLSNTIHVGTTSNTWCAIFIYMVFMASRQKYIGFSLITCLTTSRPWHLTYLWSNAPSKDNIINRHNDATETLPNNSHYPTNSRVDVVETFKQKRESPNRHFYSIDDNPPSFVEDLFHDYVTCVTKT